MADQLVNKIVIDLCLQIEDTFDLLNKTYTYSAQNEPMFSNFFFASIPSRSNDSNMINDMILMNSFPEKANPDKLNSQRSHYESIFYYTASCFNQLFIGSGNIGSNISSTNKSLFYDLSRFNFYSSCFSAITSKSNKFKLDSNYSSNFLDFFNNFSGLLKNLITFSHKIKDNPFYISNYISVSNLLNCLSRFDMDLFNIYITETDINSNISQICEDSLLLIQNEKSFKNFFQHIFQIAKLCSTDEQKLEFFSKLYKILDNIFVTRPDLYRKALSFGPEIFSNIEKLMNDIINHANQLSSPLRPISPSTQSPLQNIDHHTIGSLDREVEFPLICILSSFSSPQDKYQSLIFSVFNEFLDEINSYENNIFFNTKPSRSSLNSQSICTKEIICGHMQAYVSLYQSVLLSKDEQNTNPEEIPPMANFIRSVKDIIDKFLFKESDSIEEIMSSETVKFDNEAESLIVLQTIYPLNIDRPLINEKENFLSFPSSAPLSNNSYGSSSNVISDSRVEYLNSFEFIHNFLPNYLALDIANIPNNLSIASNSEINIPLSVMSSLNSTDLNRYISLLRALNLIMNGYPFPNIDLKSIKMIVKTIFQKFTTLVNLIENQTNFQLIDAFYLSFFQLISGFSLNSRGESQNEFQLNGKFLDFICNDTEIYPMFFNFLTSILRTTDSKSNLNFNIDQFSSQTISNFLILLYAVFEKPSRFNLFSSNHANFILWLSGINRGLYKLYKDLLHFKVTGLYYFDSLMMKYLDFLIEMFKSKSDSILLKRIVDDIELILMLMNATSNPKTSELINMKLKKFADNAGVQFLYNWPLKRNQLVIEKRNFISTIKFCYLFWFRSTFQFLYNHKYISFEKGDDAFEPIKKSAESNSKVHPIIKNKLKSRISFNIITRLTSFLCQYSFFFDDLIPLLTKYEIKNPKIKFLNAILELVLFDINEINKFISITIHQLDRQTLRMLFKIIRSNLLSSSSIFSFSTSFSSLIFKPITKTIKNENLTPLENLYLAILELLSDENVFTDVRRGQFDDQYYLQVEDLVLNLIKNIQMDSRYSIVDGEKALSYKKRLLIISKITNKFYSIDKSTSSDQFNRLTIISILLSYAISIINNGSDSKIPLIVLALTPLPVLFKNFKITAKNGLSPHISDHDDHFFTQKCLSNFMTSLSLILTLTDEIELRSIIQDTLENILTNNFYETLEVVMSSLLNYTDKFQKLIMNALITIIPQFPQFLSKPPSNSIISAISSNNFNSILESNIHSIYYYESIIDICISQNKMNDLFRAFCNQYKNNESLYFFISFFKIAATQNFINELSLNLFLMKLEKTIECFVPPIQFVYYWQLFCKLTQEEPFNVLDKFFLRPLMLQPHIYNVHPNPSFNSSQIGHFIQELKSQKRMNLYLDHLMNADIDYFEIHLSRFEFNCYPVISHFTDSIKHPGNFTSFCNVPIDTANPELSDLNRFDLVEIVFSFIDSQCLVCIDENKDKHEKWLFDMSKFPSSSLPILHECLRVLFLSSNDQTFLNSQKESTFKSFYEDIPQPVKKARSGSLNSAPEKKEIEVNNSDQRKGKHPLKFKLFHKNTKQAAEIEKSNNTQSEFNLSDDTLFQNITLYIDMRKLPKIYLNILESLFCEKFKNVYLIWPPIGILTEIETKLLEKKKVSDDFSNIKVLGNVDNEKEIILPFHLPTLRLTSECNVNDKLGSIGFFLEYIVISAYEVFRGKEYKVSTIFTFNDVKPLRLINKTTLIIEFKDNRKILYDNIKFPDITINFDLKLSLNIQNPNQVIGQSNSPNSTFSQNLNDVSSVSADFIMTAFERTFNCDICDKTVLHQYSEIDPKIALITFSLLNLPNYASIMSEASIKLFDLCISNKPKLDKQFDLIKLNQKYSTTQKAAETLSLPLEGILEILQQIQYKNMPLFDAVVLFIAPWLSNASERGMPMLTSLITTFLTISKDELSISYICRNLLKQFDESNQAIQNAKQKLNSVQIQSNTQRRLSMPIHDSPSLPKVLAAALANKAFQLLHIWSVVQSPIFTRIAIPQILVYVGSTTIQSQLIVCLSAKNKAEVNNIFIEKYLYNDLISFHLYKSIFSPKLFNMFQSLQVLGNDETIVFLSLVVALTASEAVSRPFIDTLINSKRVHLPLESNKLFDPETSDLLNSFNIILDNLDESLKLSVLDQFEKLNENDNPNIWYLNPKIEPNQLLNEMTKSFVPVFQDKKLCFILSKLKYQKDKLKQLFWVALPLLFSKHNCLRMNSIKLINELFECNQDSNVFSDTLAILKSNPNLLNAIKAFDDLVNMNLEGELSNTFASILFISVNYVETKEITLNLMQNVCLANMQYPDTILEFILMLVVFGEKHDQVVLKQFKNDGSASQMTRLELLIDKYISTKSFQSVLWIVLFILWSFKIPLSDNKFSNLAKSMMLILKTRLDVAVLMHNHLISELTAVLDIKQPKEQIYIAHLLALINSQGQIPPSKETDSAIEKSQNMFRCVNIQEQHLHSFCVIIQNAIKDLI